MKGFLLIAVVVIAFGAVVGGLTYAWRYASNVTTQVSVTNPEPGVHCALASTADGTAISCYPDSWVKK